MQVARAVQKAVAAVVVVVEVVPHPNCVGTHAGVDVAVAQYRDVQPIVAVGKYVEVRSVVLSKINRIGQNTIAALGTQAQIGRMGRGIRSVFLPLVGNGGILALRIGKHIITPRRLVARRAAEQPCRYSRRQHPTGLQRHRKAEMCAARRATAPRAVPYPRAAPRCRKRPSLRRAAPRVPEASRHPQLKKRSKCFLHRSWVKHRSCRHGSAANYSGRNPSPHPVPY